MKNDRVVFHFKYTATVAPKDGQECLVFNPCDGYRVAEWYEPGNCFLQHDETLSQHLAVLWMELPDSVDPQAASNFCNSIVSVEINQIA